MPSKEQQFARLLISAYIKFLEFYQLDTSKCHVDNVVLLDICKRYFKDVDRLHRYHGITRIDAAKISGFSTYWISKLKPISIIDSKLYSYSAEFCIYINEIFALYVASGRLLCNRDIANITLNQSFLNSFLYTLKYRKTSGDTLSLIYYLVSKAAL